MIKTGDQDKEQRNINQIRANQEHKTKAKPTYKENRARTKSNQKEAEKLRDKRCSEVQKTIWQGFGKNGKPSKGKAGEGQTDCVWLNVGA